MFARLKLAAPCDLRHTTLSRARTSSQLAGLVAFLPSALARHAARSPPSPWGKEMACACASPAAAHGEDARKATAPPAHDEALGAIRDAAAAAARAARRARRGGAAGPPPAPRPRRGAGARSGTRGENAAAPRRRRRDGDGGADAADLAAVRRANARRPRRPRPWAAARELPGGPRRVPARPQRATSAGARPARAGKDRRNAQRAVVGPDAPRAAAAEPGAPVANAPRQERRSGPARRAARRSGGGRGSGVGVDACRRRACIAPERHGTRHLDRPRRPRRRDLILTPWHATDRSTASPRLPGPGLQDTQAARRTPPRRLPATWGGPSDPTARALRGG